MVASTNPGAVDRDIRNGCSCLTGSRIAILLSFLADDTNDGEIQRANTRPELVLTSSRGRSYAATPRGTELRSHRGQSGGGCCSSPSDISLSVLASPSSVERANIQLPRGSCLTQLFMLEYKRIGRRSVDIAIHHRKRIQTAAGKAVRNRIPL